MVQGYCQEMWPLKAGVGGGGGGGHVTFGAVYAEAVYVGPIWRLNSACLVEHRSHVTPEQYTHATANKPIRSNLPSSTSKARPGCNAAARRVPVCAGIGRSVFLAFLNACDMSLKKS